jgi:DNA-directed RNA polymerase specialized sigma24 family protein
MVVGDPRVKTQHESRFVSHWENMDFERLYKVLRVAAEAVVRDAPESFNMGFSAQDLAHEAFSAFLDSSNGLGWNPGRGTIDKFLVGVLWNKARTHLRRHRKVGGSLDDPRGPHWERSAASSVAADVQFESLREKIYEAVGDDRELRELIAATEQITGEHNVNQELAEILGKTVREVVNLKRRLLNNSKVVNTLWPRKNF